MKVRKEAEMKTEEGGGGRCGGRKESVTAISREDDRDLNREK